VSVFTVLITIDHVSTVRIQSICRSWKDHRLPHFQVQGSQASWKVEFLWENFQVLESPGNLLARFWKVLDTEGSFWLQIDIFLQMKIAIIVGLQVCQKCF